MNICHVLQEPEKKYHPLNYWGWLENITPEESRWQVEEMNQAGLGGYVMHARGGLEVPYMGEQWMDSVHAILQTGAEQGMLNILDDEDGWPSGFGAGLVNGLGPEYWQKWLTLKTMSAGEVTEADFEEPLLLGCYRLRDSLIEHIRTYKDFTFDDEKEEILFISYIQNQYYVDNLDPKVVQRFLDVSYEAYYQDLKDTYWDLVYAIFSDEPQIVRGQMTWSLIIPDTFLKRFGYDIMEVLPALYYDTKNADKVRYDYWQLVNDLFVESYAKQIYTWCEEHHVRFTGHSVLEENLPEQLTGSGGTMKYYEYEHIPGVDWLDRSAVDNVLLKQVVSVSSQLQKERTLCEMYGCSGWNASFMDFKWIAELQYVMGINMMLQHLGLYSLKGSRKREYPPSIFYQQPWWKEMSAFNLYFSRLSKLITESTDSPEILIIHPLKAAWRTFNMRNMDTCSRIDADFHKLTDSLIAGNYEFHYGDEDLLHKYASVCSDGFKVGACTYQVVVVPFHIPLDAETQILLENFRAQGGLVIEGSTEEILQAGLPRKIKIITEKDSRQIPVYSSVREWNGGICCYLLNPSREETVTFTLDTCIPLCSEMDINECILRPFEKKQVITLAPAQSVFLTTFSCAMDSDITEQGEEISEQELNTSWTLVSRTENSLTLDRCSYRIDGGEWQPSTSVILLQNQLLALSKPVDVDLLFSVTIDELPGGPVYLVLEEPDKFTIQINGEDIESLEQGWWIDKSMRKIEISRALKTGKNTILLHCNFWCSEYTYKIKNDPTVHEAESNRITVETELESIYLTGDFDVNFQGSHRPGGNGGIFFDGEYHLSSAEKTLPISGLIDNGYPFFSGSITLSHKFHVEENEKVVLELKDPRAALVKVSVNGKEAIDFFWAPYEADVTEWVEAGENVLTLTLINTCRNLFGPHHNSEGELFGVGPHSYYQNWTEEYCLVPFGIEGGVSIHKYDIKK